MPSFFDELGDSDATAEFDQRFCRKRVKGGCPNMRLPLPVSIPSDAVVL
jgi:hypothetical protein